MDPIGNSSNPVVTGFHGKLGAETITPLLTYISTGKYRLYRLFSVITAGAQIENIMFTDCTVMGKSNVGLVFEGALWHLAWIRRQ